MNPRRASLQPAHRGYRYQDIATAYVLIRGLAERYDEIIVDRKLVEDDRIDDLEVRAGGRRIRRQFKSSEDATRPLAERDFTALRSSLRIDRLVLSYVREGGTPADEYRLCTTWASPAPDDQLAKLLVPVTATPTLANWQSSYFQLSGEAIWPADGAPIWSPLTAYATPGAEFSRPELLAFCERFVIELGLPIASTELAAPGPLERALIEELAARIGIGLYPNHGRAPADVAALAISLANLARMQAASLSPPDIERELEIRVDFGRVAQAFPLDLTLFHDRPTFRRTLREAALAGKHQIVVGPPGAGKSWELTRLAEELRAAGAVVARHYCYLEPGDDLVERRITTDVFFGNLLGELVDADPQLQGAGAARYAAGIAELEATLAKAAAFGRPVVLLVDGLDHIARVRSDARRLADVDTDIVERLATLKVPAGVAVVIGSQPGSHLAPLHLGWGERLSTRLLPVWAQSDLAALAKRHGVTRALGVVGVTDRDEAARVLAALADRADGNPLYARYLAHGLVAGLLDGKIASPYDWIAEAPVIGGDIALYYAYLYRSASDQAQAIADLLGVIDFAVGESDLREMLPAFVGAWVKPALIRLAPVLTSATGQGGVRVFHESFRRFMTQELARQGRSSADALAPVIEWLKKRGFFMDAKSYRFLLPALRRAGRGAEVIGHVNAAFVSDSVAQAHPSDAIQRNLALTADIAAEARDWPALVRCAELHRSAYTCFDESQNDWRYYWATYVALFGPTALAERLLFDGHPTLSASDGLYVCGLVDDAGGTAPWREYLDLFGNGARYTTMSADTSDRDEELTAGESVALNAVHGRLRLGGRTHIVRRLLRYLRESGNEFKPLFLRQLASRLARMEGANLVERIAQRADRARSGEVRMTLRAAAVLRLGIADELARSAEQDAAAQAATRALGGANTPELVAACIGYGASANSTLSFADLASLPIAVGPDEFLHDASGVRTWVATVRLLAADSVRCDSVLDTEVDRVDGPGWYRCWLRFVIALARTEVTQRSGRPADARHAFMELTRDVHPFTGKPRACDLWAIRSVIRETVVWGLSLLRTEAEWRDVLDAIAIAAEGTASRLDREDGGPLPTGMLLEVLLPYVMDPVGGPLVHAAVERQMARSEAVGTYYPTHAEYAMRLALVRHAIGDIEGAHEAWCQGAVFFAAYGWRKDATLFDLIKSASALCAKSQEIAMRALADAQPLANAAIAHTDGRTTKHAPNAWLRSVLEVNPAVGICILARTIQEEDGPGGWPNAQAVQDLAECVRDIGDPALLDDLLATLVFKVEYEDGAIDAADARLAPVVRLATTDRTLAAQAIRRIAAEVSGDGQRYTDAAAARVVAVAAENDLLVPHIAPSEFPATNRQRRAAALPRAGTWLPAWRIPPFAREATLVDLLAGLREAGISRRWDDADAWDDVVLALSYHLGQLADAGHEDDARRLLRFFARDADVGPSGKEHPLGKLAGALEAAGYNSLAAMAYALAYTATRGGGGWLQMGDQGHAHLISRGVELDAGIAQQVVADEVAYALRGNWYSMGISRHLIERLAAWGEPNVAEAAWRAAFTIIAHRLPLAPEDGWFARLEDAADAPWLIDGWSVDEALVALLLARLSDPRLTLKLAALAGVVRAIERRPDTVAAPLRWWLTRNTHFTSVLLVFDALGNAESAPFPITEAVDDVLRSYVACDLWGVRRLAAELLARAGRPETLRSGDNQPVDNGSDPDSERQGLLLSADASGVLKELAHLWPALPVQVARRMHRSSSGTIHKERIKSRYRLAYGRDGKSYPSTPTLFWEVELFELALHEALMGLSRHLWTSGQWEQGGEEAVLRRVLPNARLHLGLAASRTARPAWPMATAIDEGVGVLPVLSDDDPTYAGWTRLALVERQYVTDPKRPYSRPIETVTVFAGPIALPLGASPPPDALPFMDGEVNNWWWPSAPPASFPPRMPLGRIVRLTRITDWLGNALVLVPPAEFHRFFQLMPAEYAGPLVWNDSSGVPAVALRTWRVHNPKALHAEPVSCQGEDLIIRPDLLERVIRLYMVPIHELRVVWRRPISDSPDDDY